MRRNRGSTSTTAVHADRHILVLGAHDPRPARLRGTARQLRDTPGRAARRCQGSHRAHRSDRLTSPIAWRITAPEEQQHPPVEAQRRPSHRHDHDHTMTVPMSNKRIQRAEDPVSKWRTLQPGGDRLEDEHPAHRSDGDCADQPIESDPRTFPTVAGSVREGGDSDEDDHVPGNEEAHRTHRTSGMSPVTKPHTHDGHNPACSDHQPSPDQRPSPPLAGRKGPSPRTKITPASCFRRRTPIEAAAARVSPVVERTSAAPISDQSERDDRVPLRSSDSHAMPSTRHPIAASTVIGRLLDRAITVASAQISSAMSSGVVLSEIDQNVR